MDRSRQIEEQYDQGLHLLPFRLYLLDTYRKWNCSTFRIITVNFLGVRTLDFYGNKGEVIFKSCIYFKQS